ncbi:MAG: hypothetical protein O8C66_03305 [Candidatus Methanoperedens sp.]|nr:hypothetical protein [Candidatus Methanoperedens sp.]MCZ7369514.1 hypothetical protein [Candidatus Methanoperedens sp.]
MNDVQGSMMEGFYSHFFGRDLVYLIAGGLFISIFNYTLWGEIDLPQLSSKLIGFLAIFYIAGVALHRIATEVICPIEKDSINTLYKSPYDYKSQYTILQDLIDNYDEKVLNSLERLTYFSVLEMSIGSASLLGGFVMSIVAIVRFLTEKISPSVYYILLAIILPIFGYYMLKHGHYISIEEQKNEVALIHGIKLKRERTLFPYD